MDELARAQHRVGRAEWLGTSLGNMVEGRHGIKRLLGIAELHLAAVRCVQRFQRVAGQTLHQLADLRLDHEYHLIKTGTRCVIYAVIHQDLAMRPHTVHLLIAAIARTHTGCHDHQCCMHFLFLLLR